MRAFLLAILMFWSEAAVAAEVKSYPCNTMSIAWIGKPLPNAELVQAIQTRFPNADVSGRNRVDCDVLTPSRLKPYRVAGHEVSETEDLL